MFEDIVGKFKLRDGTPLVEAVQAVKHSQTCTCPQCKMFDTLMEIIKETLPSWSLMKIRNGDFEKPTKPDKSGQEG